MIDLELINARLKDIKHEGARLFSDVKTAMDQESVIADGIVTRDTAFVIPLREFATDDQRSTGRFSQPMTETFAVMIAMRSVNDRLGANINARLRKAVLLTRKALLGWQPTQELDEIEFLEGEIVAFLKGGAFWMEQFKTSYIYEQE